MIEIIHNALKFVNTSSTKNSWPGEGALIIGRKILICLLNQKNWQSNQLTAENCNRRDLR